MKIACVLRYIVARGWHPAVDRDTERRVADRESEEEKLIGTERRLLDKE